MKIKARLPLYTTIVLCVAIAFSACTPIESAPSQALPTSLTQTITYNTEAVASTYTEALTSTHTQPADTIETTETTETTQETLTPETDYIFVNSFGDTLDIRDADAIYGYDKLTPEEALKKDEYIICYNDFTYLTKTSGISFNSIDNSFDYENEVFNVEVPEYNYEFLKVKVGDKFEALTVKSVYVDFDYYKGSIYEGELEVSFSGNHTVNGYIIVCDEGEGYIGKGDIILYADAKTWGDIPIVLEQSEIGRLGDVTYSDRENGFFYLSDIHAIWLGNAYEDYENSDFISLMQEGDYQHVTITISGLKMFTRKRSGGNRCSAKIESISLLDE